MIMKNIKSPLWQLQIIPAFLPLSVVPVFSREKPFHKKDCVGYLFAYFTDNHITEEAIYHAVSTDRYNYRTLNGGEPSLPAQYPVKQKQPVAANLIRKNFELLLIHIVP